MPILNGVKALNPDQQFWVKSPKGNRWGVFSAPTVNGNRIKVLPNGQEYIRAYPVGAGNVFVDPFGRVMVADPDLEAGSVTIYVSLNDIVIPTPPVGYKAIGIARKGREIEWYEHTRSYDKIGYKYKKRGGGLEIGQKVVSLAADGTPINGVAVERPNTPEANAVWRNVQPTDPCIVWVAWEGETFLHGGGDGEPSRVFFAGYGHEEIYILD